MESEYFFDKMTNHFFESNSETFEHANDIQNELNLSSLRNEEYSFSHAIINAMESRYENGAVHDEFFDQFHDEHYKLALYTALLEYTVDYMRLVEQNPKLSIEDIKEGIKERLRELQKSSGEVIADNSDDEFFFKR